jgi:YVTN family beta-propeller protein/YD repeat-containing protein
VAHDLARRAAVLTRARNTTYGAAHALGAKGASGVTRSGVLATVLAVALLAAAAPAAADIVYLYDDLNRLVRVIREDGEAASYHYDAVGNILRITRESGLAQSTSYGAASTTSASRGGTTSVTLTGVNVVGTAVISGSTDVTIQNVRTDLDALSFDVVVAANAALEPVTLTLTGALGSATVVMQIYPPPPQLFGFSPTVAGAGTTVSIFGNFFDDRAPANDTVLFNGTPGVVQSVTQSLIRVTVPAGATSGPITVSHGGGSASTTANFITGQVAATSVSPTSGTRGAPVHVAVSGSNLLGTTLSRPGTTFTNVVATATQVTADAAVGLGAAREEVITVSNQVTTATVAFPVVPGTPLVTSFTPISGAVGDTVNVDGGGFDEMLTASNAVAFNGVAAEIVSVTPTRIVTRVPSGATTGPIAVTTALGTATSAQNFTVVANAPLRLVTNIDAPFGLPISMAMAPGGARAYVVNQDRASVGVVDTATHTVIATIPVGVFPNNARVSPDGQRLYVLNTPTQSTADTVSVIDPATNTVITTITLGNSNRRGQAFVAPNSATVIVTHPDQNKVSVIDAATASVAAVLPTGSNPIRIAFTPDSARAYVVNNANPGSVTVIDVGSRSVAATVATSFFPAFVLPTPDGSRVYTANGDHVQVIDTATNTIVATVTNAGGTPAGAVMNAAGTRLYVSSTSSVLIGGGPAVVVVDTATNTVAATLPITVGFFGNIGPLEITPDGQRLLMLFSPDAVALVVDAVANTIVGSIGLTGASPRAVAALPDNRHLYVVCQSSNTICLVDLATMTSPDTPISRTGAFVALHTFSADSTRGYGRGGFIQELAVGIDATTNAAMPNVVVPRGPNVSSPRVTQLALDRATGAKLYGDNSRQIVFAQTATGAVTGVLTTAASPSRALIPSVDGSRLYALAGTSVVVIDTVSQTQAAVLSIGGTATAGLLSADGTRLYVADTTNNAVKIVDPAVPSVLGSIPVGTTPTRLAFTAAGQRLLTLNTGSRTVSVVDLTTNTVVGTIALSGTSFADFTALPDGPLAFVSNRTNSRIDVLDTTAFTVTTSITMAPAPEFLALTPDSARLFAVQTTAGAVTAIDTTTLSALGSLVFPVGGNGLGQPVFAPSGRVYIPRRDFDSVLVLE